MNDKLKKIVFRLITGLVATSIVTYIFWPESPSEIETVATTTVPETTTTTVKINESACLVLFVKDSSNFLLENTPCLDVYVDRVNSKYFKKLDIICRASGDGKKSIRIELSAKRAEALQFYLMTKNVLFENIVTRSMADDSPYAGVDPSTEEGKVLNRSCEVTGLK